MFPRSWRIWTALILTVLGSSILFGQVSTQGSFVGTVTDGTGAVVPNARVTARNLDTGIATGAMTDRAGNFEIFAVPIGRYSVEVAATGFKTWKIASTTITVAERSRIAPVLDIGAVSEQVTVNATEELLQAERSEVATTVEMNQIRELPLSSRNPVTLVSLVPGMRFTGSAGTTGYELSSTVQGLGNNPTQTEFQVDGLNSNGGLDEGGVVIPNVDAIAEFSVQTNSFSAENGRNPIQVLAVTKSGTNKFHGAAWEFLQNDALNARNTYALTVPQLRRNQFGVDAGGPLIHNKTFFFANFQGTMIRTATIFNAAVASQAMLQGDFSALAKPIIDPTTKNPFPNNIIPAGRIVIRHPNICLRTCCCRILQTDGFMLWRRLRTIPTKARCGSTICSRTSSAFTAAS